MFIEGRLTADPELRTTHSGKSVVSFTIATGERRQNRDTNEWEDGNKLFTRCTAWEELAENIASSLSKGDPVIARVRPFQREYETKDGEKRTSFEGTVESIGVTLDRHTVSISRAGQGVAGGGWEKAGNGQQPAYGQTEGGGYSGGSPWGNSPQTSAPAPSGGGFDDSEEPF